MKLGRLGSKSTNLRVAASTIFGLSAILPLLVVVWLLSRHELLTSVDAQVILFLALAIAVSGFLVFRKLVDRISTLVKALAMSKISEPDGVLVEAGASSIPGLGTVDEIGQMGDLLRRLLTDLRSSTERLEDLVFKLGTLNEMVELAARIPEMQDLLALVLERTMRTVRAAVGSIMLLDRERQTLRIVASRGVADDLLADLELRVGSGIAGKVVQSGEPIMVDDIERDPRFAKVTHTAYGGGSFICLPVRAGDRVIGVVNLAKREYGVADPPDLRAFTPADLQFLNALMTYVAYALDNARLLEEALQSAKQLREVVEDQRLRLTVAQQQMLQAEKAESVGRLAAGVAHEVKNPLMILLTGVRYLSEHLPIADENVALLLEDMRQAVKRADSVIIGLLELAAPRELDTKAQDVNPMVEQSLLLVKHELDKSRVTLVKKFADTLPPLMLDRFKTEQVLVNLFTNAIHAMPDGGMLTVKTGLRPLAGGAAGNHKRAVVVEVDDTGTGIPKDKLEKIFDPFFTTKPTGKGTGLGLSVARQLIEMQRGRIEIRNRDEGGVRATLVFEPYEEENVAGQEAHPDR
jgi:signal transduction histidine kinase